MRRILILGLVLIFSCNTEEECPSQEPMLQIHRDLLLSEISSTSIENGTRYYSWNVTIDTLSYGKPVNTRIKILYDAQAYSEKMIHGRIFQFSSGPASEHYIFSPIENDSLVGHDYSLSFGFYSETLKLCEGDLSHTVKIGFLSTGNDTLDFDFISGALYQGSFYDIEYGLPR